jgi:hypothetical protein
MGGGNFSGGATVFADADCFKEETIHLNLFRTVLFALALSHGR